MIYVNGMYRSGSTVIYNIISHLITDKLITTSVQKTHQNWLNFTVKSSDLNIYSFRDVRTATASLMRRKGWSEHNFPHPVLRGEKTAKEFMLFLVRTNNSIKTKCNAENLSMCSIQYETEVRNLEKGITKLLDYLEVDVPTEVKNILYECHKVETVKNYVDSICRKEDKRTKYHPNHVSLNNTLFEDYMSSESWDDATIKEWLTNNEYY